MYRMKAQASTLLYEKENDNVYCTAANVICTKHRLYRMNVKKNYIEGEDKTTKKKQQNKTTNTHTRQSARVGKKRIEDENEKLCRKFCHTGIGMLCCTCAGVFHFLCATHRFMINVLVFALVGFAPD